MDKDNEGKDGGNTIKGGKTRKEESERERIRDKREERSDKRGEGE